MKTYGKYEVSASQYGGFVVRESALGTQWVGGWAGLGGGLESVPLPEIELQFPGLSARNVLSTMTLLSRLPL